MEKAEFKQPLLSEADGEGADLEAEHSLVAKPRRSRKFFVSLILNALMFAVILVMATSSLHSTPKPASEEVYSPAREAIEYRTEIFHGGLHGERSEYMGSDEKVDQQWEDLYNDIGISGIDEASARQLPIATTPLSYDPSRYLVQLDVFHEIHCLNLLRKTLYPSVYPPDPAPDTLEHLEHCVESIRQSLQCSSDVSTISWEWSNKRGRVLGNLNAVHTCRNFEKIQDWARKNALKEDMDMYKFTPGAPLKDE